MQQARRTYRTLLRRFPLSEYATRADRRLKKLQTVDHGSYPGHGGHDNYPGHGGYDPHPGHGGHDNYPGPGSHVDEDAMSIDGLYRLAHEALSRGDLDRAIRLFDKVEDKDRWGKYGVEAGFWKAQAYYDFGEFKKAAEAFKEFNRRHFNNDHKEEADFLRAMSFFREATRSGLKQDYKDANRAFSDFCLFNGSSKYAPEALFQQAVCYERIGDEFWAKVTYKKVVEKYPRSPFAEDARNRLMYLR